MADFTLTLYQDDDTTPLFEVGTASDHAQPYLIAPTELGESEVDLQQGKASISQINIEIIDPQTGATQADRWLTALLANASGYGALNGRRALLLRDDGVVVQEGVCYGVGMDETRAAFMLQLRDVRERGRKLAVFSTAETSTVFPRGVLDGYGAMPGDRWGTRWLIPPTIPVVGLFVRDQGSTTSGILKLDGPDDVPARILTDAMAAVSAPVWSKARGGYALDRIAVSWRLEGSTGAWTTYYNMPTVDPVAVGRVGPFAYRTFDVAAEDGRKVNARCIHWIHLHETEAGAVPAHGTRIELVVRYAGPPSEAYPLHFDGSWGEFARNLLRGDYCGLDESGARVDPRLRYNEAAFLAVTTPVRIRITEPRDDLRAVLEELCKGIGAAPALNDAGEITPIRYALPAPDVTLVEINDGNAEAIAGWDHPADNAVTVVEATHPRDSRVGPEIDPTGQNSGGDGIASREVTIRRAPADLVALMGEQELKIDLWMFRALGGATGQPLSGDVADEQGSRIAVERQHQALDRFGYGGVSSFVRIRASAVTGLKVGDWVLDARSWRPNYQTGTRGGNALAQVVSLKAIDPAWYEARLIDAGPADQPVAQPTLGTVTASSLGVVSVPITALPTGGEARIDYAISDTLPDGTSPLWTFLDRTAVVETALSPALPAGETVWIRARGEAVGRRPSAWTNAVSVAIPSTPRILALRVGIDINGVATVTYTPNGATAGVRVYYALHDPTVTPTLTTYVDADAALGTVAIPGTVAAGQMLTVEAEPWTGWSGTAVTGTAGERVPATGQPSVDLEAAMVDLRGDFVDLQAAVDDALGDGVITAGERQALKGDLRRLDVDHAGMYQHYLIVYNDASLDGAPESNLGTAWTDFDSAHGDLVAAIEAAISETGDSGSTVTDPERAAYEAAAAAYPTAYGTLEQRLAEAVAAISRTNALNAAGIDPELDNEMTVVPTNADGSGGNYAAAVSTMSVYINGVDDSANWTVTATPSTGITGSLSVRTYSVSAMTTDTGYVDFSATRSGYPDLTARFRLTKAKAGTAGQNATAYWLVSDAAAIRRDLTGAYTPAAITLTGKSQTGTGTPGNYSGRFNVAETVDGSAWTTVYTSAGNEPTTTHTPTAGIKAVRARLYRAGGTSSLLDEEIIPVVQDGPEGPSGAAGVAGADGTSIVWKGSYSGPASFVAANGTPQNGWAYRNNGDGKSYVWWDGTWFQMTIDGTDGQDGANGLDIVWKGDLATPPANPVLNWVYRDSDNGFVYIYNGSAWELMVLDGSDGADGADGADGWNAYITYHDNPLTSTPATPTGDGTTGGWHTNTSSAVVWMSQKVAPSASAGTWGAPIPIKGQPGEQGPQGPTGTAGSASPSCYITQPDVAPGDPLQDPAPVTYNGSLGAGGTGPLMWRRRYNGSWTTWASTALPISTTLTRHAVHPRVVELEVRDAALVVAHNEATIAPRFAVMQPDGTLPLDNVADTASFKKPTPIQVAGADAANLGLNSSGIVKKAVPRNYAAANLPDIDTTSGRTFRVYDATAGTEYLGEAIGEGVDRATAGFDSSGNVRRAVPRARAAAELPGIDTTTGEVSNVAGTDPAVLVRQALSPSQNRFGQWASKTITTGGTSAGTSTLVEMEIEVGERVSLSALVRRESGTGVPRVRFTFGGAGVSVDVSSTTDAERLVVLEDYEIPVGTTNIGVTYLAPTGGGTTRGRRPMCNLGPRALQYEAPPFRPGRETADDVGDGTSKRVTTTSEATGGGRAIQALDASNRLTDQRRLNTLLSANIGSLQSGLAYTMTWNPSIGVSGGWDVRVEAHTVRYGFGVVSYSAMVGNVFPEPAGGATRRWYLYVSDPDLTGGSKFLNTTTSAANIIGNGYYRVGEVVVPPLNGGTPTGTAGGSGAHPIQDV